VSTDPEVAYQRVVMAWRVARETPRIIESAFHGDPPLKVFEDPAPDWCWKLAAAVRDHAGAEPDGGEELMLQLLRWCEEGDAEVRSAQLRTLVEIWVGPRPPMLRAFLQAARKTRAGRTTIHARRLDGFGPACGADIFTARVSSDAALVTCKQCKARSSTPAWPFTFGACAFCHGNLHTGHYPCPHCGAEGK
jgi:hypothetical protein